jgi:tetraacyldisaccharide 4'-kinase
MSSPTDFFVDIWYGKSGKKYFFLPVTIIYRILLSLRKVFYRTGVFKKHLFKVPIIVVGNITVGGTGKTPLVIALAKMLREEGFRPGVVSRGYGSRAPAYPFFVDSSSLAKYAGDEPSLIASRAGVPVAIDPHRYRAVDYLIKHHACDVILTDDGLQHYALERDIEIVVVDGARRLGNGHCLPMGPLREPQNRLNTVDYIVFNGEATSVEATAKESIMRLKAGDLETLDRKKRVSASEWVLSRHVHAVAGIGNPQRFYHTLQELGFTVIEHGFADHHQFTESDFQFSDDLPIIMTEKDAVKARTLHGLQNCWVLPVEADLESGFAQSLLDRLRRLSSNAENREH